MIPNLGRHRFIATTRGMLCNLRAMLGRGMSGPTTAKQETSVVEEGENIEVSKPQSVRVSMQQFFVDLAHVQAGVFIHCA